MNCPHAEKEFLPCQIAQHPDKNRDHIYYCKVCQQSYDVREIGDESANSQLIVIAGIALLIFGVTIMSNPVPSTPSAPRIESSYSAK